jgi:methylglutaconyl-CoA hydratase
LSDGELVHLEIERGVATITLDSPHNRNALSRSLLADLERHVRAAVVDERARVIVLTGTGPAFCSGADLKEPREATADRREEPPAEATAGHQGEPPPETTASRQGERRRKVRAGKEPMAPGGLVSIVTALWESPRPVVGRINGPARAGGLGLMCACDIVVAVDTATFAFSEVRVGVSPAIISVVTLPRLGPTRALELFLTGDAFDARTAAGYGFINAAVPRGELDAAVGRYVESLLKGAPGALGETKRLVREVPGLPLAEAFHRMAALSARLFVSEEAREGMTAFAEKRPPSWARVSEDGTG